MRRIKERTERHGDAEDLDKFYSSDISALKKLQMTENNHEKLERKKAKSPDSPRKDENFAGQISKRKN